MHYHIWKRMGWQKNSKYNCSYVTEQLNTDSQSALWIQVCTELSLSLILKNNTSMIPVL